MRHQSTNRRASEVWSEGVSDLIQMEQDADKAIETIREVDRMRTETTRKL